MFQPVVRVLSNLLVALREIAVTQGINLIEHLSDVAMWGIASFGLEHGSAEVYETVQWILSSQFVEGVLSSLYGTPLPGGELGAAISSTGQDFLLIFAVITTVIIVGRHYLGIILLENSLTLSRGEWARFVAIFGATLFLFSEYRVVIQAVNTVAGFGTGLVTLSPYFAQASHPIVAGWSLVVLTATLLLGVARTLSIYLFLMVIPGLYLLRATGIGVFENVSVVVSRLAYLTVLAVIPGVVVMVAGGVVLNSLIPATHEVGTVFALILLQGSLLTIAAVLAKGPEKMPTVNRSVNWEVVASRLRFPHTQEAAQQR